MSDTYDVPTISLSLAERIADAAVTHASQISLPCVVAIVDSSGVLKSFRRMDGAPLLAVQVAQDKAYTAAGFGMPTDGWYDFIRSDGPLSLGAPTGIDRLIVFGGGYPITINGSAVGAIGVSGGHYTQDMEVAKAGLSVLGD